MDNETLDILPCPFCGNKAFLERRYVSRRRRDLNDYLFRYYVHCKNLNCSVKPHTAKDYINANLAIEAWNKRG